MKNNKNKQRNGSKGRGNFRSGGNRFGGDDNLGFQINTFNRVPREMHKSVCSECKKECEVPFKPLEGKPVYCRECFDKHKPKRF
jgi:CxxC-x17-CxxC domain-containing protein